ncbi:unnamed protein product [Candidatus Paraburkholderia kirkii UZHbot1]|uniref:WGS project CAFE00000000 data, contig bkir_c63 n=1 Tax=Candidatus Paraburkholderia kirkii UZHbot1 TaxID=1055526 RepID=U3UAZ6_9BURK|nr:unnamed protein product [Candidatus Paraburkholderia kirkii UZHbot1]
MIATVSSTGKPRVAAIYFCCMMGLYGVSFYLPTLIKAAGVKDALEVGLLTAVPYAVAIDDFRRAPFGPSQRAPLASRDRGSRCCRRPPNPPFRWGARAGACSRRSTISSAPATCSSRRANAPLSHRLSLRLRPRAGGRAPRHAARTVAYARRMRCRARYHHHAGVQHWAHTARRPMAKTTTAMLSSSTRCASGVCIW